MKTLRLLLAFALALAPLASASAFDRPLNNARVKDNGDVRLSDDLQIGRIINKQFVPTAPTQPTGDASDAAASSAFVQQELLRGVVQPRSGFFWTNWNQAATAVPVSAPVGIPAPPGKVGPVRVNRAERMLVGAARVGSSDFPATTPDYLEAYEAARSDFRGFRTSFAQFASLSEIGAYGVIGATRSSDNSLNGFQATNGGAFFAINDKAGAAAGGQYVMAWRRPGALFTSGSEIGVADENPAGGGQGYPARIFPDNTDTTHALLINSGAAMRPGEVFDASFGIGFANVGARFKAGMVFDVNALTRDGGNEASAIRFGAGHRLDWYRTDPAATNPTFSIVGKVSTQANAQRIAVTDGGFYLGSSDESRPGLRVAYFGDQQNAFPSVSGGNGAAFIAAVPIASTGLTDADLSLKGAGGGKVVIDGVMRLPPRTVALLPTCNAGAIGSISVVNDASGPAFGAALVGGGSSVVLALCNGSAWTVH